MCLLILVKKKIVLYFYLDISKKENEAVIKMLETLEEDDDVQNTFVNCNVHIS